MLSKIRLGCSSVNQKGIFTRLTLAFSFLTALTTVGDEAILDISHVHKLKHDITLSENTYLTYVQIQMVATNSYKSICSVKRKHLFQPKCQKRIIEMVAFSYYLFDELSLF